MSTNAALQIKRTLSDALRKKMAADNLSINGFAKKNHTGRNAIKRILDRKNTAITLKTMAKTIDVLGLQISLTVKPATPDELNEIAEQMVAASTPAKAQRLKRQYLDAFYGKPVHAESPAV